MELNTIKSRIRGALVAAGIIVQNAPSDSASAAPSITSGTGAPSAAEANGSLYLRTNGGALTTLYARISSAWAALADAATVSAIVAENTDVSIPADLALGIATAGTWTLSRTGTAAYQLRRTAAASIQNYAVRFTPRNRTSASKGTKVTGFKLVYKVSTAILNDVTVSGAFQVAPATGAAPAVATSLGTVTYDTAHDTAGERNAVGDHTMVGTFGTPVYLTGGATVVELLIACDGTATGVLDILGIELLCSETLVDAA